MIAHRTFDDPNSIEARQALLDNRCERTHPKRHRTQKRAKRLNAIKRAKGVAKAKRNLLAKRRHNAAVAAYWRGDRETHP